MQLCSYAGLNAVSLHFKFPDMACRVHLRNPAFQYTKGRVALSSLGCRPYILLSRMAIALGKNFKKKLKMRKIEKL